MERDVVLLDLLAAEHARLVEAEHAIAMLRLELQQLQEARGD